MKNYANVRESDPVSGSNALRPRVRRAFGLGVALFALVAVRCHGAWECDVPRLGSAGIDGGLHWTYDLPSIALPTGEQIALQISLCSPQTLGRRDGTAAEWTVPQVITSVAPRNRGRWVWRSPSGSTLEFNGVLASGNTKIAIGPDGSGSVTDPAGWRIFYEAGSPYRIVSPRGLMLRCTATGPKIEKLEFGAIATPTVLLSTTYSTETGRIASLTVHGVQYSFVSTTSGLPLCVLDQAGADVVRLSYSSDLVTEITTRGDARIPIQWRRLGPWDNVLQSMTERNFIVQRVGSQTYTLSASQSEATIRMHEGGRETALVYNRYTGKAEIGQLP